MIKIREIYNNHFNDLFDDVNYKDFQFKWSNAQPALSELVKVLRR